MNITKHWILPSHIIMDLNLGYRCVVVFVVMSCVRECYSGEPCKAFHKDSEPRLCNGDYTTPGRCYEFVEEAKSWKEADKACGDMVSLGSLAVIDSDKMHNFVKQKVKQKGWPETWINVCRKRLAWYWLHGWQTLAYQGCFKDDPNHRDLANQKTLSPPTQPTNCIDACSDDDEKFAGVQIDSGGDILCHCSESEDRRYGQVYDAQCDTPCAVSALRQINTYCGGVTHQIVYKTDGTRFQYWAPTKYRSYEECAKLDHRYEHKWVETNCTNRLPYICHYTIWDVSACESVPGARWLAIGRCVSIHNEALDYYEAQVACYEHPEGNMYQPDNSDEFAELRSHLDRQTSYYFGLTHEEWIYSFHKAVRTYYNWGYGQPSAGDGKECIFMSATDSYRWYNVDCYGRRPYVCSVDICADQSTMKSTTSTKTPITNKNGTVEELPPGGLPIQFYYGIGAGGGGVLLIVLIIICAVCCYKKCGRKKKETSGKVRQAVNRAYFHPEEAGHPSSQHHHQQIDDRSYEPPIPLHSRPSTTSSRHYEEIRSRVGSRGTSEGTGEGRGGDRRRGGGGGGRGEGGRGTRAGTGQSRTRDRGGTDRSGDSGYQSRSPSYDHPYTGLDNESSSYIQVVDPPGGSERSSSGGHRRH